MFLSRWRPTIEKAILCLGIASGVLMVSLGMPRLLADPFPSHRCEADTVNPWCPPPDAYSDHPGCAKAGKTYYCSEWQTMTPKWCVPMNRNFCEWQFDALCGSQFDCATDLPIYPTKKCTEVVDWCPTQNTTDP